MAKVTLVGTQQRFKERKWLERVNVR